MTMQPYELDAWLGPVTLSPRQRADYSRMLAAIEARYTHTDTDDTDTIPDAMSGALQVLVGDDTLEGVAQAWSQARAVERRAMALLTGAIIAEAVLGTPETTIAERAGVARGTVRRALRR